MVLLNMVFLNISAQRGPRSLFPYKFVSFAEDLTLRTVAEQLLREDAVELVKVEARERIEPVKKSDLEGAPA